MPSGLKPDLFPIDVARLARIIRETPARGVWLMSWWREGSRGWL